MLLCNPFRRFIHFYPKIPKHMTKTEYLYKLQNGKCIYCNKKLNNNYTKEHLIPKSFGGTNKIGNLCLVHKECNHKRGNDMYNKKAIDEIHRRLTKQWWA